MDDHSYSDVPIPRAPASWQKETVPVQIRNMEALFQPGTYTAEDRKRNFYVQGKFMENYEDHYEWNGFFERAFPVYHDMRVDQLRGYFSGVRTTGMEQSGRPAIRLPWSICMNC